ncbi:hypothetical protein KSP40_PGU007034 [Platanthera guangdongensis]|uniref:Uncharacterized protein n=1 Tax=Platanthera guangdongensis TaxID=2320717 RepID=A0ABR2LD94_9ASPA
MFLDLEPEIMVTGAFFGPELWILGRCRALLNTISVIFMGKKMDAEEATISGNEHYKKGQFSKAM